MTTLSRHGAPDAILAAAAAVEVWTRFVHDCPDDPELRAIGLSAAADAHDALGRRAIAEQQRAEAARISGERA